MKKGFTLIELLAVIVVLAVIAIIAIPIITNVIDKAKQGALKDSAYGILDSAEMYLAKNMNKGIDDTMEFTCNNGKCLSGEEEINYKGKIESGKVRIYTDSKIELCVTDNKSSALKTVANKKVEVAIGTCDYGELNYGVTALVSRNDYLDLEKERNSYKKILEYMQVYKEKDEVNDLFLIELIPGMKSSNTPFGTVISSGDYANRSAYYAFDYYGNDTAWDPTSGTGVSWVGYQFPIIVKIKKAEITIFCNSTSVVNGTVIFQTSNDGTTWEDIKSDSFSAVLNNKDLLTFEFDDYIETTYIRYYITSTNSALNISGRFEGGVTDAQVYGSIE